MSLTKPLNRRKRLTMRVAMRPEVARQAGPRVAAGLRVRGSTRCFRCSQTRRKHAGESLLLEPPPPLPPHHPQVG